MLCEKEGFIPKFYTDQPNDMVDETIEDMKRYTYTLVTEEMNLGNLIEMAIKRNEREDEEDENSIDEELVGFEDDAVSAIERELKDSDFMDYQEFLDDEEQDDEALLKDLLDEGVL